MNNNEKLNEVLYRYNKGDYNTPISPIKLKQEYNINISDIEITLIALKLEKDGYLLWRKTKSDGKYHETKEYFSISFEGKIFIENNGYVREKRKKIWSRIMTISGFVFAGIVSLLTILNKIDVLYLSKEESKKDSIIVISKILHDTVYIEKKSSK